jgi:hypothetical protein
MTVRHKNQHLLSTNGRWYIKKRLPDGSGHLRRSLHTRDINEARIRRDEILKKFNQVVTEVDTHKDLVALRSLYLSTFRDDEREILEDRIIDQSEDLASRLGMWELIKGDTPEHALSEMAKNLSITSEQRPAHSRR